MYAGSSNAIAAGNQHSLVLELNCCVWVAGDNYFGQLGYEHYTGYDTRQKFFVEVESQWWIFQFFGVDSTCEWEL